MALDPIVSDHAAPLACVIQAVCALDARLNERS